MPKETSYDTKKIVIFGIILLVIVGVIGFLIFKKASNSSSGSDQKNLFPYDGTANTGSGAGSSSGSTAVGNPVNTNPVTSTTADRLRLIANYPVTSMYPFVQNETTSEPQIDELTKQTVMVSKSTPTDFVRFNAKENGFLVDAQMGTNLISITQKSSTVIPNSQEAWFGNAGNTVILRSWDATHQTIASFLGSLPTPTTIAYCQTPFTDILKKGSKGAQVKEFQKYVNQKLSLNLAIDGSYGKKLAAAVDPLQKVLGLTPTGTYDQGLVDAMNADCTSINASNNQQSTGPQQLTGGFINEGILRGDISPDGTQMFFLKNSGTGVVGIVADIDGKNQRQVFQSELTEWRPQWVNATTIAMTTLASSEADGYMYFLNPVTGTFQKELGPVAGLTTLVNPSATTVLVGESANNNVKLSTFSLGSGTSTPLDLATLPEKCSWQNDTILFCAVPQGVSDGQYPDDWYQGNVVFNDNFWEIDTAQNSTTSIVSPSQKFDAYDLKISPDGSYFYFINKVDGTLWSYRMADQ